MHNFDQIQQKLQHFIKKYYTNEMIKGSILFLSFGLLYLIFTLLLEYFLWLKPFARTILFWIFILVEVLLLIKFIFIPLFKLLGLKKGISLAQASNIIGTYFKEVDDKLLNVLQLHENSDQSELLLASIEQKSKGLQPVPFKNAIHFSKNKKYLKYLSIPLIIFIFSFLTGKNTVFTESLDRVVHHKIVYTPPAPFYFKIQNKELQTIENKSFDLLVTTNGKVSPDQIKIVFNGQSYFLNKKKNGHFTYQFNAPLEDIDFHLEANKVVSKDFILEVVPTPRITDFEMYLNYPDYIRKDAEFIHNTGNANIPEGTKITWIISTKNTSTLRFHILNEKNRIAPKDKFKLNDGKYELSKLINQNIDYQINTSNLNIKNYEKLNYSLRIIKDQFPMIKVKSDIDSVSRGPVQFAGQLSDDYGLTKLQVTAKNILNNKLSVFNIDIGRSDFEKFFYIFPNGLILEENMAYEIFFDVFDNDGNHGKKKTRSQVFYYRNKSQQEINDEILKEQQQNLEDLENTSKSFEELQKEMDEFSKKLKTRNSNNWNDKKQLDDFIKRQKKYKEVMKKNIDLLLKNLEEEEDLENDNLKDKKEALKKRLEESKDLQQKEDLLKELKELADKLKKEDLIERIDKLSAQTKQETRSLERILELTKRFYVEKKTMQIIDKLDQLAKEQEKLSKEEKNTLENQKQLNDQFDSIQKDFSELKKENQGLKEPMPLPDTKADQQLIIMDQQKATTDLEKNDKNSGNKSKKSAAKNQKAAAKKMQQLSKKLSSQLAQMEEESTKENIKDLQQILENLVIFSFDQEEVMLGFKGITSKNADYPDKLKRQVQLKEYFEHIDDSLYTLSLRLVKISSKIQKDLADAHYNLDKSLENISDNNIRKGLSNQQYTMTAANNLADLLSDILQSLQNQKPGNGKGKGKKGEGVSLPDIIKKQSKMLQKMKKGLEPGKSEKGKSKEQMTGEQFEMYKEQSLFKKQMEQYLKNNSESNQEKQSLLHKMDELKKILLEKGINKESLVKMQQLEYELLKLEKATFDQNKDNKRKSNYNKDIFKNRNIESIDVNILFLHEDEILIRKSFDFKPMYKEKTKEYFQN